MFPKKNMQVLSEQFQRIFTLPLTRSTFRELQNAVFAAAAGEQENADRFLRALLEGKNPDTKVMDMNIHEFIQQFSIPTRVAKEVHDRGEALSMMTSDMIMKGDTVLFSTRIRRIDGSDFHFVTDAEGFLQVLLHYIARFRDASQTEAGKKIQETQKDGLKKIRDILDTMISS